MGAGNSTQVLWKSSHYSALNCCAISPEPQFLYLSCKGPSVTVWGCRPPGGYLEPKDDGPHQPKGQTVVSIHNVVRAHVFQMYFLLLQELQCFIYILQAVNPHPALCGLWLSGRGWRVQWHGTVACWLPQKPALHLPLSPSGTTGPGLGSGQRAQSSSKVTNEAWAD